MRNSEIRVKKELYINLGTGKICGGRSLKCALNACKICKIRDFRPNCKICNIWAPPTLHTILSCTCDKTAAPGAVWTGGHNPDNTPLTCGFRRGITTGMGAGLASGKSRVDWEPTALGTPLHGVGASTSCVVRARWLELFKPEKGVNKNAGKKEQLDTLTVLCSCHGFHGQRRVMMDTAAVSVST